MATVEKSDKTPSRSEFFGHKQNNSAVGLSASRRTEENDFFWTIGFEGIEQGFQRFFHRQAL